MAGMMWKAPGRRPLGVLAVVATLAIAATSCNPNPSPQHPTGAHGATVSYYNQGLECVLKMVHWRNNSPSAFFSESEGFTSGCWSVGAKLEYTDNSVTMVTSWDWEPDPPPGQRHLAGASAWYVDSSPWSHHAACGPTACGYYQQ